MKFRLGIVLSAIFPVCVCGMIAPAQAAPSRTGAASACVPVSARHNSRLVPVTSAQLQAPGDGDVQLQCGFTYAPALHMVLPTHPAIIHMVRPVYPQDAKEKGIQGTVQLSALIGKDGHVKKLRAMSGPPILVKASEAALRQWVYKPTLLNSQPIAVETDINVIFEVPKRPKAKEGHK